jgi:hypothetical protein
MVPRDFKSQIRALQGLSGTLRKECLDQYSSGFTGFGTIRDKGGYFW